MDRAEQFIQYTPWTHTEKKTARRAFEKAFEMQCAVITAEAKRMIANATRASDIWRVHDYLSEQRRSVDQIYDYRYFGFAQCFFSAAAGRVVSRGGLDRPPKREDRKH